ncbi:cell division protein ZapA, partial [Pseudomonas entomophila]|nr:cell division protein ZapA [Pseudomonas entomophila]
DLQREHQQTLERCQEQVSATVQTLSRTLGEG